jgi:hypothetical protein
MYDPFEVGKTGSRGTRGRIEERFRLHVRGGSDIDLPVSRSRVAGAVAARG